MINIFCICAIICVLVKATQIAIRIIYLSKDSNFQEDSKWPAWLIKDAKKWNIDKPNQQVTIREQK